MFFVFSFLKLTKALFKSEESDKTNSKTETIKTQKNYVFLISIYLVCCHCCILFYLHVEYFVRIYAYKNYYLFWNHLKTIVIYFIDPIINIPYTYNVVISC